LLAQNEKMAEQKEWPAIRADEVIYESRATVQKMIPEASIMFQFSSLHDDEKETLIKGNEGLLKVAIINLIKNAINYSTDKKVQITLVPEKQNMKIKFEHTGTVLCSEEANELIVPFFRGANVQKVKGYG
jgi:K+-sensing histidine kinase KdpD